VIGLGSLRAALSLGEGYEPTPPGLYVETDTPRGYYLDFRAKTTARGAVAPEQLLPADLAQLALGWWERHLSGDAGAAERFLDLAAQLESVAVTDGGELRWPYPVAVRKLGLRPPWLSALAQGQAASVFVRAYLHTRDERIAAAARCAIAPLLPGSSSGLVAATAEGPVPEEAPTDPPSLILNGWIYALWGLWDVAHGLADTASDELFTASAECLRRSIDRYDTGWWSLYSRYPFRLPDLAKPFYHRLHIDQLDMLYRLVGYDELQSAARRWRDYDTPAHRAAVVAEKALLKGLTVVGR
jgi:heparosan-N-sulfate-glucuronate 5-epimerase